MKEAKIVNDKLGSAIRQRLNTAIDATDEIPKGFGRTSAVAALLNETPQTVRLWLSDGVKQKAGIPEIPKLLNLTKRLNIRTEWLLEGTGPMKRDAELEDFPVSAPLLASTWQFVSSELADVIDINSLTHKSLGDILEHVYDAISDYKEGVPAELLPFVRKTINKQTKSKIELINNV